MTLGAVMVLVGVGGGVAFAMAGRPADRYTTATVTTGEVQQTVSAAGTVASATRRDVAFPVAGTVASVAVRVGDAVTAGQVLASLDPTSLQEALDQANDALAQAQQKLSDDLDSQSASSTASSSSSSQSSGSSSSPQPSSSSAPATGGAADVTPQLRAVAEAQRALLQRYDEARTALGSSTSALTAAQAACADLTALDPTLVVPDPTPTPTPTPTTTTSEEGSAPPLTSSDVAMETGSGGVPVSDVQTWLAACQAALTTASGAQDATAAAQQAVDDAAGALDAAVTALQDALRGSSGSPSGPTSPAATPGTTASSAASEQGDPTTSPSSDASGWSGAGASSGPATVASAADILADRAAIDAAQAAVDLAARDLTLVDLTAPVAGTVGAVSIAAGDQVAASSTTAVITVLGTDGYVVDLTVPVGSIDLLAVGQRATVQVASSAEPLAGAVSSIGVLNVSDTSSPEYAVVVALEPTAARLFDGSAAQVTIAVAGTGQVLTVPTSAVRVEGRTSTVRVLEGDEVTEVEVERGAVGTELTEIVSGLSEGQRVVLADRSEPLDTGSSSSSSGLSSLTSGGRQGGLTVTGPGGGIPRG